MSLKNLLNDFSDYDLMPIPVDFVKDWILEHGLQDEIHIVPIADMDPDVLRGQLRQWSEQKQVYGEKKWVSQISYSTKQTFCWQRVAVCKELMHIFDQPAFRTNTRAQLEKLTFDLVSPSTESAIKKYENNPAILAEDIAYPSALCVLAPLHILEQLRPSYEKKQKSDYDIALFLRIPEVLVSYVFSPVHAQCYRLMAGVDNVIDIPAVGPQG